MLGLWQRLKYREEVLYMASLGDLKKIVDKLNGEVVTTVVYHAEDDELSYEVSSFRHRLANTCEQGCLVLGKSLIDREELRDDWDEEIKPNYIYCETADGTITPLGDTYTQVHSELEYGAVSQLTNTQWFEGEDYWATIFGELNFSDIKELKIK